MSITTKMLKILGMSISAVAAILCIIYLQAYGTWTTLLIDLLLIILVFQTAYQSSKAWKYWIACVISTTCLIAFAGLRVRHNEEGRIQLVSALYPICPKVYIEGTAIDTIKLATGYSTFAGWYYSVRKSRFYAIKDTNQLTTIWYHPDGRIIRGYQMIIEEYNGPHGTINIFNYMDDNGNRVRRDFYGKNADNESYTPNVMDNADYIPDYIL